MKTIKNIFNSWPIKSWKSYFGKKERTLLWIIFIVGMVARVYGAATIDFWRDEVYIFFVTRNYGIKDLFFQNHWDTPHPALYYLFIYFWQKISINPFFLRIPGIVTSAIALYLVPILAKEIKPGNKILPAVSLFVYAISQPQINLSFQAKPYIFEIPLMILSLIFFFKILNKTNSKYAWVYFGVINFLLFVTDYSGLWVLGTYGLFFFIFIVFKRRMKKIRGLFIKSFILTFILSLTWLPIFVKGFQNSLEIEVGALGPLFQTENHFISNLYQTNFFVGSTTRDIPAQMGLHIHYWNALLFLFSLFGIYVLWRENRDNAYFLLLGIFAPVIISFIFSIYVSPIFLSRNLNHVNIFIGIGYAVALSYIFANRFKLFLTFVIFLFVDFLINNSSKQQFFYDDLGYDWDRAASYIKTQDDGRQNYLVTHDMFYYLDPLFYYALLHDVDLKLATKAEKRNLAILAKESNLYFADTRTGSTSATKRYQKKAKIIGCELKQQDTKALYFAKCEY